MAGRVKKKLQFKTLDFYRVWTDLSFLSGKRASIRKYPLDPRGYIYTPVNKTCPRGQVRSVPIKHFVKTSAPSGMPILRLNAIAIPYFTTSLKKLDSLVCKKY